MDQTLALFVNAVGWTLLHSLWQGAIIGLLFYLSQSVLRSASPIVRHTNALAWLVLFIALPFLTFVGLLLTSPSAVATGAVNSILPAMQITPWSGGSISLLPKLLPILGCCWMAGVLVLALRLVSDRRALDQITRAGSQPLPQLDSRFAELRKTMQVRSQVVLAEAANATVPMLVGVLKPMIILPSSALLGLSPRELELIIAHELGHLRRKDHLVNYVLITAETLLFYHPVVYALTRTIRHERELCCDDLVISTFNERICYAHALSKLETLRGVDVVPATTLRLAATDGPLVTRIARMVRTRSHKRWGVMPAALLPFVAATFVGSVVYYTHVASSGHGRYENRGSATPGTEGSENNGSIEAADTITLNNTQEMAGASASENSTESVEGILSRVSIPSHPRRTVAASTVSRITNALTAGEKRLPFAAIERGAELSTSRAMPLKIAAKPRPSTKQRISAEQMVSQPNSSGAMVRNQINDSRNPIAASQSEQQTLSGEPTTVSDLSDTQALTTDLLTDPVAAGEAIRTTYIPSSVNAQYAPLNQQAGLPALPSYRPGLATVQLNQSDAYQSSLTNSLVGKESEEVVESGGALLRSVTPRYPSRARSRGLVDKVVVAIHVDETGKVSDVSVVNQDSRAMFQRAVVRAVAKWEFEPLLRNGKPVNQTVEQSFDFRLQPFTAKSRTQTCRDTQGDACNLSS